jgi:hypothetical protein
MQGMGLGSGPNISDLVGRGKGSATRTAARGASAAGAIGAVAVGGAALSYAATKNAEGAYGEQLYDTMTRNEADSGVNMLGAMDPDAAVGAYVMQQSKGREASGPTPVAAAASTPAPPPSSSTSAVENPEKNKTAAILEAEKKGAKKNLSVTADKMSFKADSLSFKVQSLTIDAGSVKKSEISKFENKNVTAASPPSTKQSQATAPGGAQASTSTGSAGSTAATMATGGSSGSAGVAGGVGGAPPKAAGSSENAKTAIEFFKSKGWSPEQAAAIVGNLQAESGKDLNPGAVGDNGKAMGIAQWHPDRRKMFEKEMGMPFEQSDLQTQLAFVNWELTHSEKKAGDRLREARSAAEASAIVDKYYERSSGIHRQQRESNTMALLSGGRDSVTVQGAGAGRGSVNEKPGERAAAMAAAKVTATEVDAQFMGDTLDPEVIREKPTAAPDNRPWWKKALGVTDETVAKTLELEKNGPVMTAMGDIAAPGGAYVPEQKPDLTVDPKTNILDDIKQRKLEARTKTVMVDDPNWDRHAQSRRMYEEATARENRGENSQSMYWAAEQQRKKELAMKAPQIKQTVKEKGDFGNPLANALEYGAISPELQGTTEVDPQFMGVTDPETLGQTSIPPVQAVKDAAAVRSSGEAMASMREAAPRLAMEDKDREDMYGENTRLQRDQIVKTATTDNLVGAGMSPARAGKVASPRNAALAIGGGPEASREASAARSNDENNMEVVGDKPEATMNGGDGWMNKFFPYLFGASNKPSLPVGAD